MGRSIAAFLLTIVCLPVVAGDPDGQGPPTHERFAGTIVSIEKALESREFTTLDRLHDELLASHARTSDGTWMIESFEWAFDNRFAVDTPMRLDRLFEEWRAAAPASSLRSIAEAFMWQNRAWRARGTGCSPAWAAGAEKIFKLDLQRAARALAAAPGGKSSPLWYTVAIRIAGAERRPAGEIEALLAEGDRGHPAYRPVYWARATFLLPAWGGNYGEFDRFARRAVERTRAAEGKSFYAGLYADMVRTMRCGNPLTESAASWPDMREAFEDMIERHDAAWNWNLFGTFACRFRDADAVATVLAKLGTAANLGIWSSGISTETCRAMVRPPPPPSRVTWLSSPGSPR